ncbi:MULTISPECIES: APC family permease [Burkholderia]|uniref:APC family permease n=1 Tax=Burkholderia TaxID=32008 RepID=UPI0008412E34|nr:MULTISPECIES: APC family permease [unclassified Burkholderia]AOK32590.1 APC family amino acid permease [Burkholderia sp. Bp7605]
MSDWSDSSDTPAVPAAKPAAQPKPAAGSVGFPTALASAVGLIMASPVILTATSGFGAGGWVFALAMAIAFVMMQAQATTFSEAAAMLPTAGSVYDYLSCGLGRFWAITGTISAYFLVHVFAGTAETILSGVMALVNFESLNAAFERHNGAWLVGVGLVTVFAITNIVGIQVFSKLEVVLTAGMWLSLMIFGVLGLVAAPAVHFDGWFGPSSLGVSAPAVLSLVGMAMFMFVGCEFVTPLAPEMMAPGKTISRAMALGLVGVAVCMFVYGAAIKRQVPNVALSADGLTHLLDTPGAIPAFALQVLGPLGRIWFGIAFLCAGAATINTLMAGLPRILYGMALDGALPKCFAYLHPRFKTPVVGIVVAAVVPIAHAWLISGNPGSILHLVLAATCAWGTAYLLVTLSVVLLRIRRPDLPRPYRSPWFPLPQIVSSIGIVLAIVYIAPPGMSGRDIYIPFGTMLGLTALYALFWTIVVQRKHPFRPVPVEEALHNGLAR